MGFLAIPVAASVLVAASIAAEIIRWALPAPLGAAPWIQPFITHSGLILFSFLAARILGPGWSVRFGLRSCRLPAIARAVAVGFALGALTNGAMAVLRLQAPPFMQSYSITQQIVLVWLWASLAEEILSRGLLQGMMAVWADRSITLLKVNFAWPTVASAVFFAVMHLPLLGLGGRPTTVLAIVAFALVLGLVAGQFRHITGSLWPAVAAHAAANAAGTLFAVALRH